MSLYLGTWLCTGDQVSCEEKVFPREEDEVKLSDKCKKTAATDAVPNSKNSYGIMANMV